MKGINTEILETGSAEKGPVMINVLCTILLSTINQHKKWTFFLLVDFIRPARVCIDGRHNMCVCVSVRNHFGLKP